MKLVFILYKYFDHGGMQRDFMRIAKACLENDHEIHVIAARWKGEAPKGFQLHLVSVSGLTNHARIESFAKEANKAMESLSADLAIGFNKMQGLDFYFAADVCLRYKMRNKKWLLKLVPRYRSYLQLEKKVFSRKSKTKIFYLTPKQKEQYVVSYQTPDERFFFLPAGLEKRMAKGDEIKKIRHDMRKTLAADEDEIILLFVGSSFRNKGLDRAIDAAGAIKNRKCRLLVFGQDDIKKHARRIKKQNLAHKIQMMGTTDHLVDYMYAADILIHPARVEAAGMVLLEAIISGLPIITTANCGYAFHVEKSGGLVMNEIFNQTIFNERIKTLLEPSVRENIKNSMLVYADKTDFYNMAEQAVFYFTNPLNPT